jgi:hypothetical protein
MACSALRGVHPFLHVGSNLENGLWGNNSGLAAVTDFSMILLRLRRATRSSHRAEIPSFLPLNKKPRNHQK